MIRLFYNYYEDKNPARKREIDFCLHMNKLNTSFETIVVESAAKPTYDFFFQKINELAQPDDISIICNSDIFFDSTIQLVSNLKDKQMYALLRWEWHGPHHIVFHERPDSQDTWIVKGKVENVKGDFTLGIRGCDNRIAYEFQAAGYTVLNPAKSIKSYHVHNSMIRNYTMADVVPPPYYTLMPTAL